MDPFSSKEMLPAVIAFLSVTAAAGVAAAMLFFTRPPGTRWLPLPRIRWGRWTGADVVIAVFTFFLSNQVVFGILQSLNVFAWYYGDTVPKGHDSLWIGPLALPLFLALTLAALRTFSGTYPVDVGVSRSRWRANLLLGCAGFALVTPVVLFIQGLLLKLFLTFIPGELKEHRFVEMGTEGMMPLEWCLLAFSAVAAAPLVEEFLFRGLILGWLRRASMGGHVTLLVAVVCLSLGSALEFKKQAPQPNADLSELADSIESVYWSRVVFTVALAAGYVGWLWSLQKEDLFQTEMDFPLPNAPQRSEELSDDEDAEPNGPPAKPRNAAWEARDLEQQRRKSGLAVVGSSLAFALVHPSWPDPVPLLVLGLVLGWLAQRTQNLLPGIVFHALFNAVAVVTLLLKASFDFA